MVNIGVLVGTDVFDQVVDINARFALLSFVVVDTHHHTTRVDEIDPASAACHDGCTRVHCDGTLNTCAYQRLFSAQAGYRLALHVRTHQCAVCVIVLKERNQRSCNRHDLCRRHIDVFDLIGCGQHEFIFITTRHQFIDEATGFIGLGIRLGNHIFAFFNRGQIFDFTRDLAVADFAVRCFDKAVIVYARIQGERVDQANVRTFRRLDRTYATIVGRMYVTNFEACTLARQTTWAQCRNAAFMGNFGQRIGLIHKLRKLAGTEELLDRCRYWLGVDQIMRHQVFAFRLRKAFAHRALDAHKARPELIFGQFTYRANATITQVVDIIDFATAIAQLNQDFDDSNDIFGGKRHRTGELFTTHATVELHPSNGGEIIAIF